MECSERAARLVFTDPTALEFLHYCELKNRIIKNNKARPEWCPMDEEKENDNTGTSD